MAQKLQDKLRAVMEKKYGAGIVSTASDRKALAHIPYGVSAQSLALDLLIGRPGFPAGRLSEICGLEHKGKSTLGYLLLAECQRVGGIGVLIETEHAFESTRLETLGVNTEDLILLQPNYVEQAMDMIEQSMEMLRVKQKFTGPIVIVLDTIARMPSSAELEGDFAQQHMAHAARMISLGLRKLIRPLGMHKAVLVFMNQLTHSMERWGDQYDSYGGQAIKSCASLRIRINYQKKDVVTNEAKQLVGAYVHAYTMKNKLALPFQVGKYYLSFGSGIDPYEDLWLSGSAMGILKPGKGAFVFKWGAKTARVTHAEWPTFVDKKFKDVVTCRERFTALAIQMKKLTPYGQ